MKKAFLFILFITLFSCKSSNENTDYKSDSSGSPYEILVVVPKHLEKSAALDSLNSIFDKDMPMIYPEEPIADLISVAPDQMTTTLKRHRNIIYLRTGNDIDTSSVNVTFDLTSRPQMVVYIDGRNADSLTSIIMRRKSQLEKLIDKIEKERFVQRINKYPQKELSETIQKMFGVSVTLPRGYKLRNTIDSNFLWASYEMPEVSQGLFIYTYPYDTTQVLSMNSIMLQRDSFGQLIPGSAKNSFMTTSKSTVIPVSNKVVINGRQWIETRGFWELYGDYMGGPFVSYTTIDYKKGKVFCIDEYVYSPKPNKGYRNYLRTMESIVHTVSFK